MAPRHRKLLLPALGKRRLTQRHQKLPHLRHWTWLSSQLSGIRKHEAKLLLSIKAARGKEGNMHFAHHFCAAPPSLSGGWALGRRHRQQGGMAQRPIKLAQRARRQHFECACRDCGRRQGHGEGQSKFLQAVSVCAIHDAGRVL